MKPISLTEREKKVLKFSAWVAGSLFLLFVIFRALLETPSGPVAVSDIPARNILRQYKEALQSDLLLHQRLQGLEAMDKKYASLISAPGSSLKADSMHRAIKMAEQAFRDMLDSTVRQHADGDWSDSLVKNIDVFQKDLDNRQTRPDFLESKGTLLDKDIRIADLQAEISAMKNGRGAEISRQGSGSAQPDEIPVLRKDFDDLQKNYNNLAETNSRLRKVNETLNSQLSTTDPAVKEIRQIGEKRTSSLEHKIDDLNAELYFSTVDCNLSRVDVNQIISNSKQRRALLKQAMDILTSLKNSANPEIHQRAEQKIEWLTKITSTVRD